MSAIGRAANANASMWNARLAVWSFATAIVTASPSAPENHEHEITQGVGLGASRN